MSKQPKAEATEAFGSDSFLDIVANMVGILIILIMIAGIRARDYVAKAVVAEVPKVDVTPLKTEAERLQADVHKVFAQAKELTDLSAMRMQERNALALAAAAKQADIDERKSKLASAEREGFDLQQAAEYERIKLAHLERDLKDSVEQPTKEVVKVKTYPTPISRTVYGKEAHFQLKDGRITYVPIDELVDLVKSDLRSKIMRARDHEEVVETVGPIGNFRLKYMIERINIPAGSGGPGGGAAGTFVGVTQLVFLPMSARLGETFEETQKPQSDLQRALADLDPRRVTVTFWTYPDSFGLYRTLREQLYKRGYSVAGRPLHQGQPISGSPFGSKSAAQ